ncbi:MAG: hypothetical protein RJB62_1709 [Pseudomonadota bacterium]|jgi:hypothetical protein
MTQRYEDPKKDKRGGFLWAALVVFIVLFGAAVALWPI